MNLVNRVAWLIKGSLFYARNRPAKFNSRKSQVEIDSLNIVDIYQIFQSLVNILQMISELVQTWN